MSNTGIRECMYSHRVTCLLDYTLYMHDCATVITMLHAYLQTLCSNGSLFDRRIYRSVSSVRKHATSPGSLYYYCACMFVVTIHQQFSVMWVSSLSIHLFW